MDMLLWISISVLLVIIIIIVIMTFAYFCYMIKKLLCSSLRPSVFESLNVMNEILFYIFLCVKLLQLFEHSLEDFKCVCVCLWFRLFLV